MSRTNQHKFAALLATVSIALVAVIAAPIPRLFESPGKLLVFLGQPLIPGALTYQRLATLHGAAADMPLNDTSNAAFVSASLTVRPRNSTSARNATGSTVQRDVQDDKTQVTALYFVPDMVCHDDRAGWASDCGDGFWQDKALWASQDAPQSIGKNKWQHCLNTCCVVAKGGNGPVPTLGEMATWARSAYSYCDGPNLQTWRSAVLDKYTIQNKGDFKMCLCNSKSVKSC